MCVCPQTQQRRQPTRIHVQFASRVGCPELVDRDRSNDGGRDDDARLSIKGGGLVGPRARISLYPKRSIDLDMHVVVTWRRPLLLAPPHAAPSLVG